MDNVGTCQAVIGQFVHGPAFCWEPATHTVVVETLEGDDTFNACAEHALKVEGSDAVKIYVK